MLGSWVPSYGRKLWAVYDVANISAFPFLLLDVVENDVFFEFLLNNSSFQTLWKEMQETWKVALYEGTPQKVKKNIR